MVDKFNREMLGKLPKVHLDHDHYTRVEEKGSLHVWAAWCDVELVGIISYIVSASRHYPPEYLIALHDIFHVLPVYRSGMLPLNIYRTAEKGLQDLGVSMILMADHVRFQSREAAFLRMGYSPCEVMYEKKLPRSAGGGSEVTGGAARR